jgi:Ion channel
MFGGFISVCNIVIHALIMTAVVRASQMAAAKAATRPNFLLTAVMAVTASVLMLAHACEIGVWSLAYGIVDVVPDNAAHLYFAFVNYTTLGYGDIVPNEKWRLLGPMTAMNGVLLFGWSTAVIFEVLRKTMIRQSAGSEFDPTRSGAPEELQR